MRGGPLEGKMGASSGELPMCRALSVALPVFVVALSGCRNEYSTFSPALKMVLTTVDWSLVNM